MGLAAAAPEMRSALARLGEAGDRPLPLGVALQRLGSDAPLVACLLLSLPNALPGPPSPLCFLGLPALFCALAALLGFRHVALPGPLGRLPVPVGRLTRLVPAGPRRPPRFGRRTAAALCALLSVVVAMPVPGTTLIPALAVVLIALGTLESDGRLVDAGLVAAAMGLLTSAAIIAGLVVAVGLVA